MDGRGWRNPRYREVIQNLQKKRLTGEFTDSNLAFSDFIIQRKAYEFLSD